VFAVLGGVLAVISLLAGLWIEAASQADDLHYTFGFGPGGACSNLGVQAQLYVCFNGDQIVAIWSGLQPLMDPATTGTPIDGQAFANWLGTVHNLMATSCVFCAVLIVLYLPFVVRQACSRDVIQVQRFGKWTAIIGGVAGILGGVLAVSAYGVVVNDPVTKNFLSTWKGATMIDGSGHQFSVSSSTTAVMDCAPAAAVFMALGGALVVLRGVLCTGGSAGSASLLERDDPFGASSA
jgi:hypothetical protein